MRPTLPALKLAGAALSLLASTSSVYALWPMPSTTYNTGTGALRLASSFAISTSGFAPPSDLVDAIARTQQALWSDALAPLTPDRGAALAASGNVTGAPELGGLVLTLGQSATSTGTVKSVSEEATKPVDERDEGYELSVPADGSSAMLQANSTLGLLRGLTTFGQMWYTVGEQVFAVDVPVEVVDSPAFVRIFASTICYPMLMLA